MFFLTTFTKLKKKEKLSNFDIGWDLGNRRTVGFFKDQKHAMQIIINNVFDLCETIYDYAVIEELKDDQIYPEVISRIFYKVENITTIENGNEVYNSNLKYKEFDPPEDFVSKFHSSIVDIG